MVRALRVGWLLHNPPVRWLSPSVGRETRSGMWAFDKARRVCFTSAKPNGLVGTSRFALSFDPETGEFADKGPRQPSSPLETARLG